MYFENEVGTGVLKLSVQQTCVLQETKQLRQNQNTLGVLSFVPLAFACFLNVGLEHSRFDLVLKQSGCVIILFLGCSIGSVMNHSQTPCDVHMINIHDFCQLYSLGPESL